MGKRREKDSDLILKKDFVREDLGLELREGIGREGRGEGRGKRKEGIWGL